MRRTAVDFGVPLLTNIHLVKLFCESVTRHKKGELLGLHVSSLPELSAHIAVDDLGLYGGDVLEIFRSSECY
jgi:hypothetical protein